MKIGDDKCFDDKVDLTRCEEKDSNNLTMSYLRGR
jgi:hypothetical protein